MTSDRGIRAGQAIMWLAPAGRALIRNVLTVALATVSLSRGVAACVGADCLRVWSTANGGGALAIEYDFGRKVQTFESFCTDDRSQCFYTTIDPGFLAPSEDIPGDSFFPLRDGTHVRVQVVSSDPEVTLSVNGRRLRPGESASIGTMPNIHTHPSWQLLLRGGVFDDYRISYRLTTDSSLYRESEVYTSVITNVEPASSPTPTATPTPIARTCRGDCNRDGAVSIDELILGVNMALRGSPVTACPSLDANENGVIEVADLIQAVNASLFGCVARVSFAEIQNTIFTPRCAISTCHDAASATGNLVLEAGVAYGQLVNVSSNVGGAPQRVAPGQPERSFLLMKLQGPPRGMGSRMPLTGDPLSPAEIDLIRNWILQGASAN